LLIKKTSTFGKKKEFRSKMSKVKMSKFDSWMC